MKTLYNILIALVFTTSTMLSAQTDISDFTISSPSVDDINIASTFVKTGTSFTWTQQNGEASQSNTFTIDSLSGTWDETDHIGNLSLNLSLNGYQAIFTLNGEVSGVSATLQHIDGNPETEDPVFDFNINIITYN